MAAPSLGLQNVRFAKQIKVRLLTSQVVKHPTNVLYVGRESGLSGIHLIGLARLILHDVSKDVDGGFSIVFCPPVQNRDSEHSDLCTLLVLSEDSLFTVELLATVHLKRIRGVIHFIRRATIHLSGEALMTKRQINLLATIEDIVCGNVNESEPLFSGKSSKLSRDSSVNL